MKSRSLDAIVATDERAPQLNALKEMQASASSSQRRKQVAEKIIALDTALRADALRAADVILTTVIGAGALPGHFLYDRGARPTISCIVLDEAGQCTVPAALVPLMAAAQLGRNDGTIRLVRFHHLCQNGRKMAMKF